MKLLFVTTEFPWPCTGGGRRRTLAQLRALATLPEIAHITVVGMSTEREADAAALHRAIGAAHVTVCPPVAHPIHLWDSPRHVPRMLAARALGVPYLVAKWDCAPMHALVRQMSRGVDVVYLSRLGAMAYRDDVRSDARVILDTHNVESDIMARFAARRRGALAMVAQREAGLTARYEARALRSVHQVLAISVRDARQLEALGQVPVSVVPMAVPVSPAPNGTTLAFIGSLRWHPNVAGLTWFCREVWPLVRAVEPQATFVIAGSGLRRVPRAWRANGVSVVGFQQDVSAFYAQAKVFVAPILGGSGMSVKVLDALGAGLSVVTTPDGAAGLSVQGGRELLIGADPTTFAAHVVALLRDASLREELSRAAQAFVTAEHSEASSVTALRRALQLSSHQGNEDNSAHSSGQELGSRCT